MDSENDGAGVQAQGASQQAAQSDQTAQQQAAQRQAVATTGTDDTTASGSEGNDALARARSDYETALKERDAKIAELEGEIAQAAQTAESAERLRAEMDELRRKGDEERIGFELQLAGVRNVKAARALLPDYDDDIDKLKAAEPWLFGAGLPPLRRQARRACRMPAPPPTRVPR